jgi:hypothetical protein
MRLNTRPRWGIATLIALSASAFSSAMSRADVIGLYNTGVNLGAGQVDKAWSIVGGNSEPALYDPAPVYANSTNGVFPIGYWVENSAISSWDTPSNPLKSDGIDTHADGQYAWRTQFTVTGRLPNSLNFNFAADNEVAWISLNGTTIYSGPTDRSSQYRFWTPVTAAGLQYGINTLDFHVVNYAQNGGNPTGLNVQFAPVIAAFDAASNLSQAPGPTPGAGLAGLAALALGGLYLRRRRA